MKCIFVIPRMGGGGAERVVSLLANALAEKENEVTVFTLVDGECFYALNQRVRTESADARINRKNSLTRMLSMMAFFPKAFFVLHKKLRKGKYDAVISMLPECDILVGLCKLFGLKFQHVCSERNDPTVNKGWLMAILKAVYKRAELFVCQGKRVYDFYHTVPERVKRVIPNPIDGHKLPERVVADTKRVVGVGRLSDQKNFPLLINSFAALGQEFGAYRLDIYGEGPNHASLQKQIDELNMHDRITLCGARKDVQSLIADAELFVMSSNYEGFPNALLEAMAIGLPVISTDFPTGIAVELIGEENGLVVPVNDQTALTEAMKCLLLDKERRQKMGETNREKCKAYYTPNIIARWEKAVEEIAK